MKDKDYSLLDRVRKTILSICNIKQKTLIAAVSGGPDSMAMLDILQRLSTQMDFDLLCATVRHHLRSNDKTDADLVAQFCKKKKIKHHILHVDVMSYCKKRGVSKEEAARELRYEMLKQLLKEKDAHLIATAHTIDDQAETVLLRLFKGTGIRGLRGILPLREDRIIRPMIRCRKYELLTYISDHKIPYINDPTNDDLLIERNRIRHKIMPVIVECFGEYAIENIARTSEHFLDVTQFLEDIFFDIQKRYIKKDLTSKLPLRIPLKIFEELSESLWIEFLIFIFSKALEGPRRPREVHLNSVIKLIKDRKELKTVHLPGDLEAKIDRNCLLIQDRGLNRIIRQ